MCKNGVREDSAITHAERKQSLPPRPSRYYLEGRAITLYDDKIATARLRHAYNTSATHRQLSIAATAAQRLHYVRTGMNSVLAMNESRHWADCQLSVSRIAANRAMNSNDGCPSHSLQPSCAALVDRHLSALYAQSSHFLNCSLLSRQATFTCCVAKLLTAVTVLPITSCMRISDHAEEHKLIVLFLFFNSCIASYEQAYRWTSVPSKILVIWLYPTAVCRDRFLAWYRYE